MSEDFLKKISSKRGNEKDNPFSKLFQEKKEKIVPTVEEKKDEGIIGIENLGTSSTSRNEDENFSENYNSENENSPLPSKDMSKENIFEKKEETVSNDSSLFFNTSSSTQDLTFDDLSTGKNSSDEDKIEKVTDMLKKGLVDESIEFIKQNFKK